MTRDMGVEAVAPLMESFFRAASDIVISRDGIIDKFLGDACMALFNVPIRRPDHIARAVAASAEIQRAVEGINSTREGQAPLQVGIGISTGFALTGRIGSSHPSDYTAIGDVVNVASRLQGRAQPGEVVVTEDVYEAVGSSFPHARLEEYELKGITEPVAGYVLAQQDILRTLARPEARM